MKVILCSNLLLVVVCLLAPNQFLALNSWVVYLTQAVLILPYLLVKAKYVKNIFLPSLFILIYYLVTFTLGAYLVPRGYGWNKEFHSVSLSISNYKFITAFFVLSNLALFFASYYSCCRLSVDRINKYIDSSDGGGVIWMLLASMFFLLVSFFEVYSAFSFQLAFLILAVCLMWKWPRFVRCIFYAFFLAVMVTFNYENKREVAVVLFWMVFFEAYVSGFVVGFTVRKLVSYFLMIACFFALIIVSSILRGYGDFPVSSFFDAIYFVPNYLTSDMFVDGITDNLELNYCYGNAINSVDMLLSGKMDYQYGATLIKVVFLPLSRDIFPDKPESLMNIYTGIYDPYIRSIDGSLPVILSAEMFANFNFFGVLFVYLFAFLLNRVFEYFHVVKLVSFSGVTCAFLFITVLFVARGAGIEQYLLYYLVVAPAILAFLFIKRLVLR